MCLPPLSQAYKLVSFLIFKLTVGEDSTLCLQKGKSQKTRITDIKSWTLAFTCYTRIVLDKYPSHAKALVAYMDLISCAASYHHSLRWLLYDEKFGMKAANYTSLSWTQNAATSTGVVPCYYSPHRYIHECNFPGCGGTHTRIRCYQTRARSEPKSADPPLTTSGGSNQKEANCK